MCGAVRFQARGSPSRTIHCHCTDCRKHTGAPMACLAVYTHDQVTFSGEDRGLYASTPGVARTFCPRCGASLTFETDLRGNGRVCAIHISAFDGPESLTATHHSYYAERISWFDVADDLPRYKRLVVDGELICHGPAKT
ncbi:MAG TPA: GFA family protein [Thermohalobaculum sp.]|nr:GFA family protein [Thermohalobaculum sp.]